MINPLFEDLRVAIRGGGDLGSGVAYRLWRCGFPVLITELAYPLLIRRAVSFGSAVIEGSITIEGVTARRIDTVAAAIPAQSGTDIPVLPDPSGSSFVDYQPAIIVDARMLKANPGSQPGQATLVIGLGPGFDAPGNCDAVIETRRGHTLGRVIRQGRALADTREPEKVLDKGSERAVRAPTGGIVTGLVPIGAIVQQGQAIARVDTQLVGAPFAGALRGLAHNGLVVEAGTKIADIDPRSDPSYCFTISDKALAIGGGVLDAIFSAPAVQDHLRDRSWK